jgi:hypothetical protein
VTIDAGLDKGGICNLVNYPYLLHWPSHRHPRLHPVRGLSVNYPDSAGSCKVDHSDAGIYLPFGDGYGDHPYAPQRLGILRRKYADKNATFYRDIPESEWLKEYYRAFIDNPYQEELFWQLLEQFREIRTERSLDDDKYLELMTVFVQSIPYKTDNAGSPPKFPVETIADRNGDCDDKSLLLSGLLAYEGYNVSLLYFSPEEHMAVGVAGSGSTYRDTGYLYIETTNPSYVGMSPKNLTGGVPLRSYPLVVRIGNGTRSFQRNNETQYIGEALASADGRIVSLRPDILSYKQKIDDISRSERLQEYTALVEEYNALIREHNENVRVYEYILQHQHDREGTYQWLKEHGCLTIEYIQTEYLLQEHSEGGCIPIP